MNEISPQATSEQLDGKATAASSEQTNARERLHEDVLTHLTKSAVKSVSQTLSLDLSEDTARNTATWVVRAAKSVPLFMPAGRGMRAALTYGSAAALYGASEMKWGDRADNMGKDALLGGLKGIAMKGSMDLIGAKMHQSGLDKKIWAAPAQGVAFGITGTAAESALSRSTYYDETGKYRGIGYGLAKTGEATANIENLAIGAATFTLGAGSMKLLQSSGAAKAFPELIGNRIFQNSFTGFSFGAFSGMSEEARRQVKEGNFNAWEVNKFDFAKLGKEGLFAATSDAAGAAVGAKIGLPRIGEHTNIAESENGGKRESRTRIETHENAIERVRPITSMEAIRLGEPLNTVENTARIEQPSGQTIRDQAHLSEIVEAPLRKAVSELWDKNIQTTGSGVFHQTQRRWDSLGSSLHVGEYQAPYYLIKYESQGKYSLLNDPRSQFPNTEHDMSKKTAYIVIDEQTLSPTNQMIARKLGRVREDRMIEVHVPVEPGTPAHQLEQAMIKIANQFEHQPLNWGYMTPIEFYRQTIKTDRGIPSDAWMMEQTNAPEFKQQGLVFDAQRNLIFQSKELADKYNAAPPPEPTWYRGPETFGQQSRGSWRQAYNQVAINAYSPEAHGLKRPTPETARLQERNFDLADLSRPENAQYYLSSKERFFELFGTKAYDALADRHWLEMRNKAFESVEKHWPSASVEKDRALALGTVLLARAYEGHGHFNANEAWVLQLMVPQHLWREPSGRKLSTQEVVDQANRIYDDMNQVRQSPFDHVFAKEMLEHINGTGGDQATDKREYYHSRQLSLENVMENGWDMKVDQRYVPLIREVAQKQSEGMIPERFEKSVGEDGMDVYTPVYRQATQEERILPLSELVKNLKVVDYGFKDTKGTVLGKVSLASHDVHDHARAFWLLDKAGLFSGTADNPGYSHLMGKLADPQSNNIFRREGELVASVAYDWRNYFDSHPDYQPQVDLTDIKNYFLHADRQGLPLSKNQARALDYVERLIDADPQGQSPEAKKLRHIIGGVWQETLEQKRKTDNSLWKREDGSYQRMSATNPEYLAFVIEATQVLERQSLLMQYALNQNNLKMERYLQDVANSRGDEAVPTLRFTPEDVRTAFGEEAAVGQKTRDWMLQHPGFNTRRAPIRNWLIGHQSEYDAAELAIAAWRKEQEAEHRAWMREQLYRDRYDLD